MTIEQFDETRWGAGMTVGYHGKERSVASVDFQEKLIGLSSLEEPEIDDDGEPEDLPFDWVRCENFGVDNRSQTASQHRKQAKKDGWKYINGKDYCPDCAKYNQGKKIDAKHS